MKRHIARAGSILAVGLLAASLVQATSASAVAQEVIKVGVPMSLTGKFAAYGTSGKRGVEMAADVFGETVGGKKIEFLYRDVQSDSQTTVSVINELVNVEKVDFMIGPIASTVVATAIPAWQQGKPIWIVSGSSSTKLEEMAGGEDNFFHTYPFAYHYHTSEADALNHYLGEGKRVAVIYADDNYGRSHLPYLREAYTDRGFEIVAEEIVRANSPDMNPVLSKIARTNPDILVGLVQTTDAITLAKQIYTRKLGIPHLVGTAYTQLDEWQDAVGDAQNGWLGVTTYLPGVERPANADYPELFPAATEWEDRFRERYGHDPDFLDIGNYASAGMLLVALERAGGDVDKAAEELRNMDIPTVNGRGKFEPSGRGTKYQAFTDMIVFQRRDNENVVIWPLDAANGELQKSAQ